MGRSAICTAAVCLAMVSAVLPDGAAACDRLRPGQDLEKASKGAEVVFWGEVYKTRVTSRSGDGFTGVTHGLTYVRPIIAVRGPLPKGTAKLPFMTFYSDDRPPEEGPPPKGHRFILWLNPGETLKCFNWKHH